MSEMPERIYAAGCDGRDIEGAVSGEGWTERATETVYIRADIAEQREAELVEALKDALESSDDDNGILCQVENLLAKHEQEKSNDS